MARPLGSTADGLEWATAMAARVAASPASQYRASLALAAGVRARKALA